MFHTGIFHDGCDAGADGTTSGGKIARRGERRRRVLKGGRVRLHHGLILRDAIVSDIAQGGVRIRIVEARLLPTRFDFQLKADPVARPVRLVWSKGDEAGLAFV